MKISDGNSKLGKIPNVSMTPIKSCGNCKECSKDCYALKAYRMYPNVKNAWDINYDAAKTNIDGYFNAIDLYLTKTSPLFFRWHVAGDILSQEYLNKMKALAKKHTGTKFLAFTKMYNFNYSRLPANLTVIFSVWPKVKMSRKHMPKAFMQDGTETRVSNAIECPGRCDSCGMCFNLKDLNKNVVFIKH